MQAIVLAVFLVSMPLARAAVAHLAAPPVWEGDRQYVTERPPSATDLAAAAGAYMGQLVRVRSQVLMSLSPHAFVLSDEPLLAAPAVLVLVPEPKARAARDYMMTVVGTVRPFNREQLQHDYPWFKAELLKGTELWERGAQETTPVLIARSVRTEIGLELVQLPGGVRAGMGRVGTVESGRGRGSDAAEVVTTLDTILRHENAVELAGSEILLGPVRVQRVLDPHYLAVGRDLPHAVLVRLGEPTQNIIPGDLVSVSGTIEPSPESPEDPTLKWWCPVFIQARHAALVNP